jgi:Glutamine amidotransferases class-II
MLLVDTEMKTLIQDVELKTKISKSRPYGEWLQKQVIARESKSFRDINARQPLP